MKQGWITFDNVFFENEQEAIDYENRMNQMIALEEFVYKSTCGIQRSDVREIINALVEQYNITPK